MSKIGYWLLWPLLLTTTLSCTGTSADILGPSSAAADSEQEDPVEPEDPFIVTASWDGNTHSVTFYNIDGTYRHHVDFRTEAFIPRGLALLNSETIIFSGEGNDGLYTMNFQGESDIFYGSSALAGNIYDVAYDTVGQVVYVIETSNIEAFSYDGIRLTAQRINQNSGACNLNSPVDMTINSDGNLVVANVGGGDQILTYDITTTPPTCLSAVNFGNNPYAVHMHSNGYLYVATQNNDQIYRADPDGSNPVSIWATDTSVINNPQAIGELPNGNLLISSSATDTIEELTPDGTRVGTTPFIMDPLSLNIGSILVVGGSTE